MKHHRCAPVVFIAATIVSGTSVSQGGQPLGAGRVAPMRRMSRGTAYSYAMVGNAHQLITAAEAASVVGADASRSKRWSQMGALSPYLTGPRGRLMVFALPSTYFADVGHDQHRAFRPVAGIGDKALMEVGRDRVELLVLKRGITIKCDLRGFKPPVPDATLNALKALARKAASRVPATWAAVARQQSISAARHRKPEPALAGVPASALVTSAEAATMLGGQPMGGGGGGTNICMYSNGHGGMLTVLVHPSFPDAFAHPRSNPRFNMETLTGIGDKAVLYTSKRAPAEGRTEIRLLILKGRAQLDLGLHASRDSTSLATLNAMKALGRRAVSRFRNR